jgi:peptidoglycan/xylan/chitin deacetylase (PgdA/CDA1 family)
VTASLTYHDVGPADQLEHIGRPGPLSGRYKLDLDAFEKHLHAIAAVGVEVGLLTNGTAEPQAALTFDDGGSRAPLIAERLEARGWRGHFFVTTSAMGTPGFMTAEEIEELARRGHVVGSHSHTHPLHMGRLPEAEIEREWQLSREILSNLLGAPPPIASVPGGYMNASVARAAVTAGISLLMTSTPTPRTRHHDGLRVLGRYTIWNSTSPRRAAAYLQGPGISRAWLWTIWTARSAAKRLSPGVYETLRRRRAGERA